MRKLLTIPAWFVGFLIVVVVGVYVWLTQSSWLLHQLESQVNRALSASTDLSLTFERMSGDLISNVTLSGVTLALIRGDDTDTLVRVESIQLRYNARSLLTQSRSIRAIEIWRPQVFLPRDSIQNVFRRAQAGVESQAVLKGALDLALDSATVHQGTILRRGDTNPLVDSLEVQASFRISEENWNLIVGSSSLYSSHVGGVHFEGEVASRDGLLAVDSMSLRTARSSLNVSASPSNVSIRPSVIDLAELTVSTKLGVDGVLSVSGDIRPDWENKQASGNLSVDGTFEGYELSDLVFRFVADSAGATYDSLSGTVSGAEFDGLGSFAWSSRPERWTFTGNVLGFDLNRFAKETIPTDLNGRVDISGVGVTNADLRIRAEVSLQRSSIKNFHIESAEGSLGATVDSLLIGEDFILGYKGATLVGGGTMAYEDSVDFFVSFNAPDLRPFDELVFVDSLAGRVEGYAYLSGLTSDPDIDAFLNSDSLRLFNLRTGDFDAKVSIPHFLSNPSGQIDAFWGNSTTWGVATDSISLHATLSGRTIDIGWARWYSPLVDIEGAGTLDWSADTIPFRLYPLTLRWENQTYSASSDIVLSVDSLGVTLQQFQFEGPLGIFYANGRIGFDNSMALDFELDRFRIARVSKRFFPTWDLDGVIAARGQLYGHYAAPVIEMAGDVSELEFEGESYGSLEGIISYRNSVLTVESAELDNRYLHAEASGTFPVNLSFEFSQDTTSSRVLSDEPLTGRLEASGDNLDPINRFLPQTIESIRGKFALRAAVAGTPSHPRFSGEATLSNGTIKTIEILNPLEDVAIDVALKHDTVIIRNASAVVRDKKLSGQVDVTGSIRMASLKSFDYDLQVTGRHVPARMEFKDFFVVGDFDLSVFGPTPPKVTGRVLPQRIEDREPFTETESRPVYDAALWDWDIAIDMPEGGYSIRNDQLEAELSADLRLLRERGQPSYIGTAEFIRGKVYLFDKVGRIKRGVLTFDDPLNADPRLDLDVVFRIQQPRLETHTETSSSLVVDLKLHIAGRASEPLIEPEATYSEQDVLLLLAANTSALGGGDSLSVSDPLANRLKFAATGLVFSEVQRMAARKLGLETLEINSGENPFDASITVGRYFSPQLYLYGTTPVDAGAGQEVGFEYRLSRRIFLDGNRDKNNLYRLNLHFNWEY